MFLLTMILVLTLPTIYFLNKRWDAIWNVITEKLIG